MITGGPATAAAKEVGHVFTNVALAGYSNVATQGFNIATGKSNEFKYEAPVIAMTAAVPIGVSLEVATTFQVNKLATSFSTAAAETAAGSYLTDVYSGSSLEQKICR